VKGGIGSPVTFVARTCRDALPQLTAQIPGVNL
jgi:hypothetical protein